MGRRFVLLLSLLLCCAVPLCLMIGPEFIGPGELWEIIAGGGTGVHRTIVAGIRLPKVLAALFAGASLAVSGTVFQALLRNPLAEPFIMGVSGGAAFGVALTGIMTRSSHVQSAGALGGALLAVTVIDRIASGRGGKNAPLILSGISLSFILSSAVLLIYAFARPREVHFAMLWLMGNLSRASMGDLYFMMMASTLLICTIWVFRKHLDIISFGDDFAEGLGVSQGMARALFWGGSLLAAVTVTVAGVIGFVGLIVPHVIRKFTGPSHSFLIPGAAAGGALFLLVCDTFGSSIAAPYEIPVGIITGFTGGIFFLFLLYGLKNEGTGRGA